MKVSGDTLLFAYESDNGYGQRFLRRAVIDREHGKLAVSPDMGKRNDGYYTSYMPYPFIAADGAISVIGQDDTEIYTVADDTALIRTNRYLMGGNCTVPFPLSQYVQDVFTTAPDRYVFIGRKPNGGPQYAMTANLPSSRIDTIRQINISPELQAWMPNAGKLAYSCKYNRLAFAYSLHPVIEIFDTRGNMISSVRIAEDTFDPETLDEADFNDLNVLHTVDVAYTPDLIYALYWGFRHADAQSSRPAILKLDWDGNIIAGYKDLHEPLYRIAAADDSTIIGWNGKEFVLISVPE